ncbi:MAG: sulfite exporter TauE/SafE family protein [Gammaproteobacteria bacterium]|nr:sulfite exporter TauE/SafE family protein [Gammaproteobacteria bacterium]NIT62341.1 sulfite exporter TauE/SafE family protein [Gammaproteobacteria bacterium]NIV19289.1 TSUP family transporter [Gammaproteobacteria bacterium]NIY30921.1 TSUP family transporter [Gammaproteobacteria bacterium]
MDQLVISPALLAGIFFAVALAYSAVGLGGGSSYTALMAIFGVSYVAIPTIALTLNVLVTSIGSYNFIRRRHARIRLIAPFLISSIPASYIGGTLHLPETTFQWLLVITLIFIAARIYVWESVSFRLELGRAQQIGLALLAGAILGLVAGALGIGGGIYLVPLVIVLGLGTPREAAACGAIFIWVNSVSGLAARLRFHEVNVPELLPLIGAVIAGAVIGSHLGAVRLKPRIMEKWLGAIVLVAIALLARTLLLA